MEELKYVIKTVASLKNMIIEMNAKEIELKRITKTSSLLLLSGVSKNSIPPKIIERCLNDQHSDGGWVSIVDTMWNVFFLKKIDEKLFEKNINLGLDFLISRKSSEGLWGRSFRDICRIPVTGILFYLLPELADKESLYLLEQLCQKEKNTLTYKAAYTLMAFRKNNYLPEDIQLIPDLVEWLKRNQRDDGGFAPWLEHPIESDIYCTSVAALGLLQYPELISKKIISRAFNWIINNQLNNGIWKYHEIEDGASWGIYAMVETLRSGVLDNG